MDGKKPAKSRWCPYNCLPCDDDHKGRVKEYNSFAIISVGYREGWVLGSRLPSTPPIFFLGEKALGTRLG